MRDEIYFEGESVMELKASVHRAVDHYLAVCKERGEAPDKPFSGQLRLRMDPDLHRSVAIAASTAGKGAPPVPSPTASSTKASSRTASARYCQLGGAGVKPRAPLAQIAQAAVAGGH